MKDSVYKYSSRPTRNPFRYALALWRLIRDPKATEEAAIVEIGFLRSRLGGRLARLSEAVATLTGDPRTAAALAARQPFGPIDLERLAALPEATLGRAFADHCRARGLDPNLVQIRVSDEADFVLARLYATHDIWHLVTGWGNDEVGEVGLGGFYAGQNVLVHFFAFMMILVLLNTLFVAPTTVRERLDAFATGHASGKRALPLFGVDWEELWSQPLAEVRARFQIDPGETIGEGIRAAA